VARLQINRRGAVKKKRCGAVEMGGSAWLKKLGAARLKKSIFYNIE